MLTRTLLVVLGVLASLAAPVPAAHAQARVSVSSDRAGAVIDPTYATTLEVGGTGFQSVRGGHGGIYVFFGTVSGSWRPSKGGVTGQDYFYVPDSESQANAGYQKYVAYPGSDTAASANGGTVSASGRWSTTITVPGATFQAVDRSGGTRTIDCRKVRCGIITVGAHGVTNAANETFTPVTVQDLYGDRAPATKGTPAAEQPAAPGAAVPDVAVPDVAAPQPATAPVLDVDRPSAIAGRALSFTARGLAPGAQVNAVLDDGVAAAGPFLVGAQGQVTGVVTLPAEVAGGTHELRLYGLDGDRAPVVRFAIAAGDEPVTAPVAPAGTERSRIDRLGTWFFGAAGLVLLGALARLLLLARRGGASRA